MATTSPALALKLVRNDDMNSIYKKIEVLGNLVVAEENIQMWISIRF